MGPPAMNYQNSYNQEDGDFGRKSNVDMNKAYVDLDDPMICDHNAQQPSATMVGAIGGSFSKKAT